MKRFAAALASMLLASPAYAELSHAAVEGASIDLPEIGAPRTPGVVTLRFSAKGEAVEIPHCNGRGRILVDGAPWDRGSRGPKVFPLDRPPGSKEPSLFERALDAARRAPDASVSTVVGELVRLSEEAEAVVHEVRVEVDVSAYEKRVACSGPPKVGKLVRTTSGLSLLRFDSPHAKKGGGEVVVFVPKNHDPMKPGALLVGAHPWNGSPWTYAAYRELLEEADAKDVVLAMPSGLGNSLYVEDAEDEVMRAIDAVGKEVAIDPRRVSIWGASMGGAGATTIAFHRPDRFAFVASYFGDSRYDLSTYVKSILRDEAGAKKVNALDVVENARHLPVFLVHGEADRTSPIVQSTMLYDAMKKAGFQVELERVPGMGHEAPLVIRYIRRVVDRAAEARAPENPARVSFRSVRPADTQAYGVRIERAKPGDAFVDIENRDDGIHVLRADNVSRIVLRDGALGASRGATIHGSTPVSWEP